MAVNKKLVSESNIAKLHTPTTPALLFQMSFPQGHFFIKSRGTGQVLDIPNRDAGQSLVVNRQRNSDIDSQLWSFDNGFLINKNSKRVLDIRGGQILAGKQVIQYDRKLTQTAHNQLWGYRGGFIHSAVDPSLVLDIKGGSSADNTPVILYNRKASDALNQLWDFVPADITSQSVLPPSFQQPAPGVEPQQQSYGIPQQQSYAPPQQPYSYGQSHGEEDQPYGQPQGKPYGYTVSGYGPSGQEREYHPIRPDLLVPRIEELEQIHRKIYINRPELPLSYDNIAAGAAFEAIKIWREAEGNPMQHTLAKEQIASTAMNEVVKLADKLNWKGDREEAKQAAAVAVQRYYVDHYGHSHS